jgi:hypothetical protein
MDFTLRGGSILAAHTAIHEVSVYFRVHVGEVLSVVNFLGGNQARPTSGQKNFPFVSPKVLVFQDTEGKNGSHKYTFMCLGKSVKKFGRAKMTLPLFIWFFFAFSVWQKGRAEGKCIPQPLFNQSIHTKNLRYFGQGKTRKMPDTLHGFHSPPTMIASRYPLINLLTEAACP